MTIQKIRYYGDPVLARRAKEVKGMTAEIRALIRDMLATMYHCRGVGLAAPQIGVSKRVSVIDCGPEYHQGPLVLINPQIVAIEGLQTGSEGCLSIPELFLLVPRPLLVTLRYRTVDWRPAEITGDRLLARAFLHEVDHLEGKLFIQRVEDQELVARELDKLRHGLESMICPPRQSGPAGES